MAEAFVALGSNLGDRALTIRGGLHDLAARGVKVLRESPLHVTEPVGGPPQPDFVNGVVRLEVQGSPMDLLHRLQTVEWRHGRLREALHGPRTLDLDLLWFEGMSFSSPALQLPHPRMLQRRFVMAPLAELAPRLRIAGRTVREHLACLD